MGKQLTEAERREREKPKPGEEDGIGRRRGQLQISICPNCWDQLLQVLICPKCFCFRFCKSWDQLLHSKTAPPSSHENRAHGSHLPNAYLDFLLHNHIEGRTSEQLCRRDVLFPRLPRRVLEVAGNETRQRRDGNTSPYTNCCREETEMDGGEDSQQRKHEPFERPALRDEGSKRRGTES